MLDQTDQSPSRTVEGVKVAIGQKRGDFFAAIAVEIIHHQPNDLGGAHIDRTPRTHAGGIIVNVNIPISRGDNFRNPIPVHIRHLDGGKGIEKIWGVAPF